MAARKAASGPAPAKWSREEERKLMMAVGAFGVDYVQRNLPGRSIKAIYSKIRDAFGGGGISRGTKSLRDAARATGYDIRQLTRAGRALGQRWQRTSSKGRVMLSDDQLEALVRWLRHDYWCFRSKVYACVYCGRSRITRVQRGPHGLGLCHPCYQACLRQFRAEGLEFGRRGLMDAIESVRGVTPADGRDWLDAFAASVEAGCVLTRSTLDRLLKEASGLRARVSGPRDSSRESDRDRG